MTVQRNAQTQPDSSTSYGYDPAGNVTSIKDSAAGQADTQCFTYHPLRQVKDVWTPADGSCATTPSVAGLGGPAPYWHTYDYDAVGNRTVKTAHSSAGDETTTLTYPAAGQARPHQAQSVALGAATATPVTSDAAGNTLTRPRGGGSTANQTLTWDDEGHLAQLADSTAGTTSFLYDANGERLIKREPGATTLYLDNHEVRLDTTTALRSTTRYYSYDGQTVAVRDKNGLRSLITDHLGTGTTQIKTSTGELNRRRFDLFGNPRGTAPGAWVGEQGYVGGQQDASTGMTHLGAREYTPELGRFISVDPVIDHYDPSTLNPYTYGKDNPATFSDPSGLYIPWEGSTPEPKNWRGSTVSNNIPAPNLSAYTTANYGGSKSRGESSSVAEQVAAKIAAAEAKKKAAIEQLKRSAMQLAKIAADELGITDAFNCLKEGDMGACGATLVNIISAAAGGVAGKLLAKYGLPWKWKKGAALVQRLWDIAGDALNAAKGWLKASDELAATLRSGAADDVAQVAGTNARGALTSRSSFRKGTVDNAWDNAELGPNGGRICSNVGCSNEVSVAPRTGHRDWDVHHSPEWSQRLFPADATRKQVIDNYQEGTMLACVPCNRGRLIQ